MTLHHPRHRAAMHWLRRGEIACGRAFDRQRNRLSASTNAMHATCADCWRVMAAIAAADQPSKVNDELVEWVKAHAANLPRSGWRASRLRKVTRPRAVIA